MIKIEKEKKATQSICKESEMKRTNAYCGYQ
jgi:hypothetical protein